MKLTSLTASLADDDVTGLSFVLFQFQYLFNGGSYRKSDFIFETSDYVFRQDPSRIPIFSIIIKF